jgi:hypothetical protein
LGGGFGQAKVTMQRYTNIDGSLPHTASAVFKWAIMDRLAGRRAPNRQPFEVPHAFNNGAALRSNVSDALVTWIGHATWLVQLSGVNMVIDPIWARAISGGHAAGGYRSGDA